MLPCHCEASKLNLKAVGSIRSSCLALPEKGGEEKEEDELEHGCVWGHWLGSRVAVRRECRSTQGLHAAGEPRRCRRGALTLCVCVRVHAKIVCSLHLTYSASV